jgi:hypothetical protein
VFWVVSKFIAEGASACAMNSDEAGLRDFHFRRDERVEVVYATEAINVVRGHV